MPLMLGANDVVSTIDGWLAFSLATLVLYGYIHLTFMLNDALSALIFNCTVNVGDATVSFSTSSIHA